MKRTSLLSIILVLSTASVYSQWVPSTGADGNTVTGIVSKDNLFFCSSRYEGVFVSADNGMTWTEANNGITSKNMTALVATDNALFAGNTNGHIYRSTDNGSSWTKMNSSIFSDIRCLYAAGSTIFAGATGIYRSTNDGTNWTEMKSLSGKYINAIIQKGTTLFAAGSGVYRSTDNGSNWTKAQNGISDTGTFNFAVQANKIFVNANWSIYSSTNNGSSWSNVTNPISSGSPLSCLASSGSVLFAGTFNGVYYTTNSGTTWIEANTDLTDTGINILTALGSYLFAGTYYGEETGVWRRSLSDFGITGVKGSSKESELLSIRCNPNPVHTTANFTVTNATRDYGIYIYDLMGKVISTLRGDAASNGAVTIQWNASTIPPGMYECVVRTSNEYARSVFIVQH